MDINQLQQRDDMHVHVSVYSGNQISNSNVKLVIKCDHRCLEKLVLPNQFNLIW